MNLTNERIAELLELCKAVKEIENCVDEETLEWPEQVHTLLTALPAALSELAEARIKNQKLMCQVLEQIMDIDAKDKELVVIKHKLENFDSYASKWVGLANIEDLRDEYRARFLPDKLDE